MRTREVTDMLADAPANGDAFIGSPRIDVQCRPRQRWLAVTQTKRQQCCPDGQNRYDRASHPHAPECSKPTPCQRQPIRL